MKSSGCNPKKWYECPTIGKGIPGQGSFEMNRVNSCFAQMRIIFTIVISKQTIKI